MNERIQNHSRIGTRRAAASLALAALIGILGGCAPEDQETPAKKTYTLAVAAGEHGTITPSGGTYPEGTVVALAAAPEKGFRLSSWKGTDNDAATSTANAVTMNANRTVEAGFVSLIVEDFERAGAAAEWTFSNGPEFPGAAGSFAVAANRGRSGSKGGFSPSISEGEGPMSPPRGA